MIQHEHPRRVPWIERLHKNFNQLLYFHIYLLSGTENVLYCTRLYMYHKVNTSRHAAISCESWAVITICPSSLGRAELHTLAKLKQSVVTALGWEHTQGTDHNPGDVLQLMEQKVNLKFFKFYYVLSLLLISTELLSHTHNNVCWNGWQLSASSTINHAAKGT